MSNIHKTQHAYRFVNGDVNICLHTAPTKHIKMLKMCTPQSNIVIPSDYIETIEGSATVSADSDVVSVDGTFVEIPGYDVLTGSFKFEHDNLKNYIISDGKLSFDVDDAAEILGIDGNDFTNMKVEVLFGKNALGSVNVTCMSGNTAVTYSYIFGEVIS